MVIIAGAAVAGLVGSPHCTGMCGPFAVAAGSRGASWPWHLGRLTTYVTLGAVAGSVGAWSPVPSPVVSVVALALLLWFTARLAGWVPAAHLTSPRLVRVAGHLSGRTDLAGRVGFGVITSLVPCGLLYAALALPVSAGSALTGAAAMAAFWAGTVPALAVAGEALRRLAAARPWVRTAVAVAVLATGVWSLGLREAWTAQTPPDQPACHTP